MQHPGLLSITEFRGKGMSETYDDDWIRRARLKACRFGCIRGPGCQRDRHGGSVVVEPPAVTRGTERLVRQTGCWGRVSNEVAVAEKDSRIFNSCLMFFL